MAKPFERRRDIKTWLEKQSPEVISVFAARAALRSVPYFTSLINNKGLKSSPEDIISPTLWCIATALTAGVWPVKAVASLNYAAGAAYDAASTTAAGANYAAYAYAAYSAYDAAVAAGAAPAYAYADVVPTAAADAAASAASAAGDDAAEFFIEYSWDRDFIESGGSANELAIQNLWSHTLNPDLKSLAAKLINQWGQLKQHLMSLNQDWEVWTDWYDDRLRSDETRKSLPLIEEIEVGLDPENGQYGRVTFPPEDYKDPAKVNAQIKQVIEDYWARQKLLKQDKTAETFGLDIDGKITRTTSETSAELINTPEQRDWYKSLRQAAFGMKDIGENALGKAARPVNNVLDALPENVNNAKVARLWPAANRIRKLKAAHERAVESGDDYHPNRLADEVVHDIEQFVDVYNNLVIGDPDLSEKEKAAKGPQEPETDIKAREAAAQGIEAAIKHGLFDEEAKLVIEDDITEDREIISKIEAGTSLTVLEKLAEDNIRREKENAIRAIILRVRESDKYSLIEKGALAGIGLKIVEFAGSVWPVLVGVIKGIFGL